MSRDTKRTGCDHAPTRRITYSDESSVMTCACTITKYEALYGPLEARVDVVDASLENPEAPR